MRRFFRILTIAAVLLSMVGCDRAGADNSNSASGLESSSGTSGGSTTENTPVGSYIGDNAQDGRLTVLCSGGSFMESGCGTEDGYYSLHYGIDEDDFLRITYIDYASGQEVMLCADSSCKHDTERCTSVLGSDQRYFGELFFYGEYLYYLSVGYDESGYLSGVDDDYLSAGEKSGSPLYRMNPDGTGRELVYTFKESETMEHIVVGDGDCLWFITNEKFVERNEEKDITHIGSKNRSLVRLDLTERKIVEQIPIPESDNITKGLVGVCGSRLIFSGVAYPDGKSVMDYADELGVYDRIGEADVDKFNAFMSKCEYAFFVLDVTDKTLKEVYRSKYDDSSRRCSPCGNYLYISEKSSTIRLDMSTGSTEELPVPDGYEFDGFIGGRAVYISTDGEYRRCFADPDTGELTAWENFKLIIAENSDSVLVFYDCIGTPDPNGGLLNVRDRYALITLDDLFNGRENYKVIDMLGGE